MNRLGIAGWRTALISPLMYCLFDADMLMRFTQQPATELVNTYTFNASEIQLLESIPGPFLIILAAYAVAIKQQQVNTWDKKFENCEYDEQFIPKFYSTIFQNLLPYAQNGKATNFLKDIIACNNDDDILKFNFGNFSNEESYIISAVGNRVSLARETSNFKKLLNEIKLKQQNKQEENNYNNLAKCMKQMYFHTSEIIGTYAGIQEKLDIMDKTYETEAYCAAITKHLDIVLSNTLNFPAVGE